MIASLETLFSVLLSMVRMMVSTCIRWLPYGIGNSLSVSSCPWSEWWLVHVLDDCLMALETLFSVLLSMVRMMVSTCIRWLPYGVGNSLQCPPVHGQNDGLVHVLDDCLMALETLFSVLLSMVRMMVSTCIRWLPHGLGNSLQCPPVHGQNDG